MHRTGEKIRVTKFEKQSEAFNCENIHQTCQLNRENSHALSMITKLILKDFSRKEPFVRINC